MNPPRLRPRSVRRALRPALALLVALGGCEPIERVVDGYRDLTPHEAYLAALGDAGLAGSALATAWAESARRAVAEPAAVVLPWREAGFVAADDPDAQGWSFELERGQVLEVETALRVAGERDAPADPRLFVDLFRVPADTAEPLRPVVSLPDSATGSAGSFSFEPPRDGRYVLRVQPELLVAGRWEVRLSLRPTVAFPVDGRDWGAVQSFFGAPRDGGAREHHGVDIFAPRHTPVVAGTAGRVSRVRETPVGGRVVWLRDEGRSQSLYYAHLEDQAVVEGEWVEPGDTIGFVGNSGNARTTPPHLHFGIYVRGTGPVDPARYLRVPPGRWPGDLPPEVGERSWARLARAETLEPAGGGTAVALEAGTAVRVLGGNAEGLRVELPDGRRGRLPSPSLTVGGEPLARRSATPGLALRSDPTDGAPVVRELDGGTPLDVLGRFGRYERVSAGGTEGWVQPL